MNFYRRFFVACLLVLPTAPSWADWSFVRGDVDGDGVVLVNDAVLALNVVFIGAAPLCFDAVDANDDGLVDLSDPVYILGNLFNQEADPPAPFPSCGSDPTADGLNCAGPLSGCPVIDFVPEFVSVPVGLAYVDSPYEYDAEAFDARMTSLTYTLELAPTGTSIDPGSGLVTWTPGSAQEGQQLFRIRATDGDGSYADQTYTVTVYPWPDAPVLDSIASPTASLTVVVTGTTNAATDVVITLDDTNFTVPIVGNTFSSPVTLRPNARNMIFVHSVNSAGLESAPAVLTVVQDQEAPALFVDFPLDGSSVLETESFIGGRVSDRLSGFMGLQVTVNGAPALVEPGIGTNGTFITSLPQPLSVGSNSFTVVAEDTLGNATSQTITVERIEPDPALPALSLVSGDAQTTSIETDVANSLVVEVLEANGMPFSNKIVTFEVVRSNGRLRAPGTPFEDGSLRYQGFTDAAGLISATWTLGSDAGCGNNRVRVTSNGIQGELLFCASATEGFPDQINVATGNSQRGEVGAPACEPLRVWVSDSCNGVAGVPVTFTVTRGSGTVNGASSVTVPTSISGHAEVDFTYGFEPGNNWIEASTPSLTGSAAGFVLFGCDRITTQDTEFTGLVFDNANRPIETAICSIEVPGADPLVTATDSEGRFTFNSIPISGVVKLVVNGLSATAVDGQPVAPDSFPLLEFHPVLVPNVTNTLTGPILLPELNPNNSFAYSTTEQTIVTVEGIEGLRLIIEPGSMSFPSGDPATDGTLVSLNIVHHDDIPMPMTDGASPPFAWTLQPGGSTFDPPIRVEYPNMSGLPPGSVTYFLTFDHDTGKFEIVASGSVVPDGSMIVSDPGAGITLAGWACNCPPYSVASDCEECLIFCDDEGTVTGGTVTLVTPMPNFGDMVIFSVDGAMDSGGQQTVLCSDGSETIEAIPPATVEYEWTITLPNGGGEMSGEGNVAMIMADDCGEYSCTFMAKVDRDCNPAPVEVGTESVVVQEILGMPEDAGEVTFDFQPVTTMLSIVDQIGAGAGFCDVEPPGTLQVTFGRKTFQRCCFGQVMDFERLEVVGDGTTIDLGSRRCDFPLTAALLPPFLAAINITVGYGATVGFQGATQQNCMGSELCFGGVVNANAFGGVSGTVLGGAAIDARLVLQFTGIDASVEYCDTSGVSFSACVGSIDLVGTVEIGSFIQHSVSSSVVDRSVLPICFP